MSERTSEWPISNSFVHLHNVGCPFLLSLLHQEKISRAQGGPQQEVTTPSQHWVLCSARCTLTSPCHLISIPLRRTKIRNLRGAAMTVLQLSHVPEITVREGKTLASKYSKFTAKNEEPGPLQSPSPQFVKCSWGFPICPTRTVGGIKGLVLDLVQIRR